MEGTESSNRFPEPREVAERVWKQANKNNPGLTNWDWLCFSIEFIAAMSMTAEWLQPPAVVLGRLIYTAWELPEIREQFNARPDGNKESQTGHDNGSVQKNNGSERSEQGIEADIQHENNLSKGEDSTEDNDS